MASYAYPLDFFSSGVSLSSLRRSVRVRPELSSCTVQQDAQGTVIVESIQDLSTTTNLLLDETMRAHDGQPLSLPDAKVEKSAFIDQRTVQLIEQGFLFAGKVFSLSTHAQSYWNGLGNLCANHMLTEPTDFPLTVNTLDDLETHDIASIAEALGFFGTASATVKARLASGTALKNQVRAATTTEEVDAVVDDR